MAINKKYQFENIYQQHHPMVLQLCLGFVKGDLDTAKDLAQEIFISVLNNLEKFRGSSSYKTWIYRITVNTCLQFVKKEKKRNISSLTKDHNQGITEEIETATTQSSPDLYKAIGQLNKIDRLIIMMVLENEDYDNISSVIGIKPTNVRVKIHRIKKQLKTILNNYENE
ncbi:RNA polymerase sigma factor [Gelidibacter mesophilus]|uniref:RNA polymerase sigma factor n=1 Tax=Gelidibacter mesophilus TaxID=169050 RepID=UPI0004057C43|nr:RNA polymerase sigma factor [Gelidibacter mesophilus]